MADVVQPVAEDGKPGRVGSAKGGRKGAGRLEGEGPEQDRDGLHSAPTSDVMGAAAAGKRAGLHSAPINDQGGRSKGKKGWQAANVVDAGGANAPSADAAIGDFILEGANGAQPNAGAVDAYLDDIIGSKIVKELRGTEWAGRVQGLEALQNLVKRQAAEGAVATGETEAEGEPSRAALFRACVTVLSRALQDKVVPVYLPALALLAEIYSPPFLSPLGPDSTLPRSAVALFAEKLVFRAGSSNVRAQQESSGALLSLARCDAVGCAPIGPAALRPLSNSKSAHASVGRLELLRTLVSEVRAAGIYIIHNACIELVRRQPCGGGGSCTLLDASWLPFSPLSLWRSSHFGPCLTSFSPSGAAFPLQFGIGASVGLELREVLTFALPFFESGQVRDADKSRDAAVGLVIDIRAAHNPRQVDRIIEDTRPTAMAILKARLAPPDKSGGSLSVSGKRLPPLAPIALGSSGTLPGAMPPGANGAGAAEEGEEVMAYHGTPPDAQSRARARTTATELGIRNAPNPKKKAAKRPAASPASGSKKSPPMNGNVAHDIGDDDILAEASNLLADMPAPRRMAAPKAHDSPPRSGVRDENMTEDQLMASIMDESLS